MPRKPAVRRGQDLASEKRREFKRGERRFDVMRLWLDGMSYREIEKQMGVSKSVVASDVNQALGEMREELWGSMKVDVEREFTEQLSFTKKLRKASEKWLFVDGEVSLDARDTEAYLVYTDKNDLDDKGKPKKKKALVAEVMEMLRTDAIEPVKITAETVDRKFALEYALKTIATADTVIDKFARIDGLYTKDKENPATVEKAARAFHDWAKDNPTATDDERKVWISRFASSANVPEEELAQQIDGVH